METGMVTLDEHTVAPAIKLLDLDGGRVLLYVFLPSEPVRYEAVRGDAPGIGVFVSDG
jgi:hypothetical protein